MTSTPFSSIGAAEACELAKSALPAQAEDVQGLGIGGWWWPPGQLDACTEKGLIIIDLTGGGSEEERRAAADELMARALERI
jgi:hypothetical protein